MLLSTGPSSLANCPVTACLLFLQLALNLFLPWSPALASLTRPWIWQSSAEWFMGCYLIYCGRVMERLYGSGRYLSMTLWTECISRLVTGLLLGRTAPGLHGWLMTMLLGFYMDVPVTASIKYGGVRWSDKLLIYVLALQLWLSTSQQQRPLLPHLMAGFLLSLGWRMNWGHVQHWTKCPQWVVKWMQGLARRFLNGGGANGGVGGSMNVGGNQNAIGNQNGNQNRQRQQAAPPAPAPPPVLQPPPSDHELQERIETLVAMGFDAEEARRALVASEYLVERAVGVLLNGNA